VSRTISLRPIDKASRQRDASQSADARKNLEIGPLDVHRDARAARHANAQPSAAGDVEGSHRAEPLLRIREVELDSLVADDEAADALRLEAPDAERALQRDRAEREGLHDVSHQPSSDVGAGLGGRSSD
jgi:hypothetical protein